MQQARVEAMTYAPKSQVITLEYVQAPRRGHVIRVPIENITHFTFGDKYASAHTTSGELLLAISLHEIEEILGDQVVRLHRSCIAMKSALASLRRDCTTRCGWAVVSTEGPEPFIDLRVSRAEYPRVRKVVGHLEVSPA